MPNMPRLGLLLVALAFAACQSSPPPALSHEQIRDELQAAMEDGDGDRAIEVLETAAEAGEWGAYGRLAEAYSRGYIQTFVDGSVQPLMVQVPLSPRMAEMARLRHEAGRERAMEEGDPYALFQFATHILYPSLPMGALVSGGDPPSQSARDSAAVIYRRIADSDLPRLVVARLAKAVGDSVGHVRHIDEAIAAGERGACTHKLWLSSGPRPNLSTLQGRAAYYDDLLDCDSGDEAREHISRDIRALHEQIALGNPESVVALDSLRHLGLFERHPWLNDLSADA